MTRLKFTLEPESSYLQFIISLLFLATLSLFVYHGYESITLHFLPTLSDEYSYYLNAKSFYLNNRLDAAYSINEMNSAVGNFSSHGFMYTGLYGGLMKIFGGYSQTILVSNLFFTLIFVIYILLTRLNLFERLIIATFLLTFYVAVSYRFFYMAESFHLMNVGFVSILIFKISESQKRGFSLAIFILLIIILSFFRQSWIFFLFALLPFARTRKELIAFIAIAAGGMMIVVTDIVLFHAPYPFGFLFKLFHETGTFDDHLHTFSAHFVENIELFLHDQPYEQVRLAFYLKFTWLATFILVLFFGLKGNLLMRSAAIVASLYFVTLLLFYDASGFREIRNLAVVHLFMFMAIIHTKKYYLGILLLSINIFLYSQVAYERDFMKKVKQNFYQGVVEYNPNASFLPRLSFYAATIDKHRVVFLIKHALIPQNYSPLYFYIPLTSSTNQLITYSFSFRDFQITPNTTADFYLSNAYEDRDYLELIDSDHDMYLYKVLKTEGRSSK